MQHLLLSAFLGISPCGLADTVLANLEKDYGEVRTYSATTAGEDPLPIVVTLSTSGSWTMLQIRNELACVIAVGEHWGGALRSPSEGPLPTPSDPPADPPVMQPHWPPQWPDGFYPHGDYLRGFL